MSSPGRYAEFGPFRLFPSERRLLREGTPVVIGSRAIEILILLVERAGNVVTKQELMARVWPGINVEEGSLRVHITNLRKALGTGAEGAAYIVNSAGRGYSFAGEVVPGRPTPAERSSDLQPSPSTNLPVPLGRVIGRAGIIDLLCTTLPMRRLVTLVGPGGIGKTTVALQVAQAMAGHFRDGAAFIDLSAVQDSARVADAAAAALGQALRPGDPIGQLASGMRDHRMLIVLDNCEHLVDSTASLAEALLRTAPGIHLLATSREPLGADGEWLQRLSALDYPPSSSSISAEAALAYSAVQLFVDRAAGRLGGYSLLDQDAPAVADLCRRLDGIALAIELAAGRLDTMGLSGLVRSLDDRFRVLTRGRRTALPRHQTLRATLDWSYELLSTDEQGLLRSLAAFNGFDPAAVSAVARDPTGTRLDVEDLLASLVAKSLVVADANEAEPSFRLLETTRAYARERLDQAGESAPVARCHAEFFRALFERADSEWETRPTSEWLGEYLRHLGNVRIALDWAFSAGGDPEIGVALTVAAVPLLFQLSLVDECLGRVEQALDALDRIPADTRRWRMKLCANLGWPQMRSISGRESGSAAWTSTLALAQQLDDLDYQLRALWALWVDAINHGRPRDALAHADRFDSLADRFGEAAETSLADRMRARALHLLGEQMEARENIEKMLAGYTPPTRRSHTARYQYDQRVTARITRERVLWVLGFPDQALRDASDNIDLALSLDHTLTLSHALSDGACPVALLAGDLAAADHYTAMLHEHTGPRALDVWHTYADGYRGEILVREGDLAAGLPMLHDAATRMRETHFVLYLSAFAATLAMALASAGQTGEALGWVDESLTRCAESGEGWYVPELHRVRGEILLLEGDRKAAEACFRRSAEIARTQRALSWELRAVTSLARLRPVRGRSDAATVLLGSVLDRFTEGFDTADLLAARQLLDKLESEAG